MTLCKSKDVKKGYVILGVLRIESNQYFTMLEDQ